MPRPYHAHPSGLPSRPSKHKTIIEHHEAPLAQYHGNTRHHPQAKLGNNTQSQAVFFGTPTIIFVKKVCRKT